MLELACRELKIEALTDDDYIFLKEYLKCIAPVAVALKNLEGDRFTFGIFLPTLVCLRSKLDMNKRLCETANAMIYCHPLSVAIQLGFETRFGDMMDIFNQRSKPLWIAMVSNPQYKLDYIGMKRIPEHTSTKVRNFLYNVGKQIVDAERIEEASPEENNNTATQVSNEFDDDEAGFLIKNDVSHSFAMSCDQNIQLIQEINTYLGSKVEQNINDGLRGYHVERRTAK